MNRKRMLYALLMLMLTSSYMHPMDDGNAQPGDPRIHRGGGDPPGWSNKFFGVIDGACSFVNKPLDVALGTLGGWGAKSKLMVTTLLGYLAYRVKDKIVEDVQNAPDALAQVQESLSRFLPNKKKAVKTEQPDVCRTQIVQVQTEDLEQEPEDTQIMVQSQEPAILQEVHALVAEQQQAPVEEQQLVSTASTEQDTDEQDEQIDA